VTLEYQSAQTQQTGTIVTGRIETTRQCLDGAIRNQGTQLVEYALLELGRQNTLDEAPQPLGCLQRDIADKAVADNNVCRAFENIIAFDITVEVEYALS